jgi:hypothetical protein
MENDTVGLSLSEILTEAENISQDSQKTFGHLNEKQINWKSSVDQWSVGQCFDHLITANREFYPQLDQIIRGEKKTTLWQSMPFLPGFFGRMMVKALGPNSKQKFKAPKNFQPSSSNIDPQIIGKFVEHQHEVIEKVKATSAISLEKIVIYSPVTKVMTYSLLDAYRIIVLHERRHFAQAARMMEASGFPK